LEKNDRGGAEKVGVKLSGKIKKYKQILTKTDKRTFIRLPICFLCDKM